MHSYKARRGNNIEYFGCKTKKSSPLSLNEAVKQSTSVFRERQQQQQQQSLRGSSESVLLAAVGRDRR